LGWENIPETWPQTQAICDYSMGRIFSHNPAVAVIVTLEGGKQVAGLFIGDQATASSDPEERDLYLPFTCNVENGNWTIIPNSEGILIKGNKIVYLEFFEFKH
jgi:hypothetical protein